MTSSVSDFYMTTYHEDSKNLAKEDDLKANVISSLIDGLPVTIFWALSDSTRSIQYILGNIVESIGYFRIDFLSKSTSAKSQSFDKNKAQKYIEC